MTNDISIADKALLRVLLGKPVARSNQSFAPHALDCWLEWMYERRASSYVRCAKVERAIRIQSLSIVRSGSLRPGEIPGMAAELDLARAFNLMPDSRAKSLKTPPKRT